MFRKSLMAVGLTIQMTMPLHAQTQDHAPLRAAARAQLEQESRSLGAGATVTLGKIDERLQLPACQSLTAFMPPGARAWGHTTVGLRCAGPTAWQIQIPAHVAVQGEWLASARALQPGQPLTPADWITQSGDLTQFAAAVATRAEQVVGMTLNGALAPGQALRLDQLRAPLAIRQGQSVKLISQGAGFRVSSEGQALANASEGQILPVRMPSGNTINGIARSAGSVEVKF
jgi:flagella basal body P-ring formation protein FlgA